MAAQICIDAGILIKQVVPEQYSDLAAALWEQAIEAEWEIVAPALFWFEVTAVLRKKVYRRTLMPAEGELALTTAFEANVHIVSLPDLHRRAWHLADKFQQRPISSKARHCKPKRWAGEVGRPARAGARLQKSHEASGQPRLTLHKTPQNAGIG